jgi:murein peptide amidase A
VSESRLNLKGHLPASSELRRQGKNISGYLGETIDIKAVLEDCTTAAQTNGWRIDTITTVSGLPLLGLSRAATHHHAPQPRRVYISAGIHGDEPAAPLAVRQLLKDNRWPSNVSLWLCPCLNPSGYGFNRRENPNGIDLNRDYLNPKSAETNAHIAWLHNQSGFDLCLCLHEDWESHGFYVYELNPEDKPSLAPAVLRAVEAVCPLDRSEIIEGRPAKDGLIRPSLDPRTRPQWPESFFLITHKTRLSYTLEAPSDFPLSARVAALVTGVETALRPAFP